VDVKTIDHKLPKTVNAPTPLAFPILVDRLRMKMSSEKLADKIARLQKQFENNAQ